MTPSRLADDAVALLGLPGAAAGAYLALLAVCSKPAVAVRGSDALNVAVLVPAHNEAAGIAETLTSLLGTRYPPLRRRIVVVADNCTDATASIALECGVEVLVRTDALNRGKGFALDHGFEQLLADPWVDAVVVVDADTIVDSNLLTAVAGRLAEGEAAVQADYQVRNSEDSWRTRLLRIAFAAFHEVRSSGRERLGVSCGLRGNGMAFSRATLEKVPHDAHSIVEDLEFGIRLGRAGIRVAYAGEARVLGQMPSDADASKSQRERWELGRATLRRQDGRKLLSEALTRRDPVLLDLAADLLVPPLGQVVSALGVGIVAGAVTGQFAGRHRGVAVHSFGLACVVLHVARGWQRSGTGAQGLGDLAKAPWYVGWKLLAKVTGRRSGQPAPTEWVRTVRTGESSERTVGASAESPAAPVSVSGGMS